MKLRPREIVEILASLALGTGFLLYGPWHGVSLRVEYLLGIAALVAFSILRRNAEPASWLRRPRTAYVVICLLVITVAAMEHLLHRGRMVWLYAPLLLAALWLGTAIWLREERTPGKPVSLPTILAVAASMLSFGAAVFLFTQHGLGLISRLGLVVFLLLPFAAALLVGGVTYAIANRSRG